jgi:hypothetical protein
MVVAGDRLPCKPQWPAGLVELMTSCCCAAPPDRPTFKMLSESLSQLLIQESYGSSVPKDIRGEEEVPTRPPQKRSRLYSKSEALKTTLMTLEEDPKQQQEQEQQFPFLAGASASNATNDLQSDVAFGHNQQINDELTPSSALPRRFCKQDGVEVNVKSVISKLLASDLLGTKGGGTLLHAEAAIGNHETCYLLLHRAAQLRCRKELLSAANRDGWTALQVACERGHLDVVTLLYNEGSPMVLTCEEKEESTSSNKDPFRLARLAGHCLGHLRIST